MTLVRWRPARDLLNISEEVDRFFDDFFSSGFDRIRSDDSIWSPKVDVVDVNGEIVLTAEMPGVTKDDIKITLHDNVLTLKGEKKQEKEEKGVSYHKMERSYGSFHRSFDLALAVRGEKITANFKDGLLKIRLPKAEKDKPKEIRVEIK